MTDEPGSESNLAQDGMSSGYSRTRELHGALIGGGIAALALFGMVIGVGRVGSFEALRLIESVVPTARFLAAAAITSALTILALLLALLGLSLNSDYSFKPRLYSRARNISALSVACMVMSVGLLLAVSVPIGEVDEIRGLYAVLYYSLAAAMAVVGGLLISVGLMIGTTLRGLIQIGHPKEVSDLLAEHPEEALPKEETVDR